MSIIRRALLKLPTLTLRRDMGKVMQLATSEAFAAGCDHARAEQRDFLMRHPELREHYLRCSIADVREASDV